MDIKKHFFKKFVFPKILVLDKPGLIISRNFNNLNKEAHNMRIVYSFEDFYVNLYFDTLKKLGEEKTNELWYKMGKDLGIRYFLFNGLVDFPFFKINLAKTYFVLPNPPFFKIFGALLSDYLSLENIINIFCTASIIISIFELFVNLEYLFKI